MKHKKIIKIVGLILTFVVIVALSFGLFFTSLNRSNDSSSVAYADTTDNVYTLNLTFALDSRLSDENVFPLTLYGYNGTSKKSYVINSESDVLTISATYTSDFRLICNGTITYCLIVGANGYIYYPYNHPLPLVPNRYFNGNHNIILAHEAYVMTDNLDSAITSWQETYYDACDRIEELEAELENVDNLIEESRLGGYTDGYENGYQEGLDFGTEFGYKNGYVDGHYDGETDGYSKGYTDGSNDGNKVGYKGGYTDGYSDGESDGYDLGLEEGTQMGYDYGYGVGYNEGYSLGYTNGENLTQSQVITNPISSFLQPLHDFMNTKFFGNLSYASLFNVVLFVVVALIFLKMFSGG